MKVAVITLTFALVVTGKFFLVETEDSGHRDHGKDHHGNLGKGNGLGHNIFLQVWNVLRRDLLI